jgi:GntR family transcriptional repressor for pyruvate dehydrogenase complex
VPKNSDYTLNLAQKIADKITQEIRASGVRPGDSLPPESAMCATYKVSRTVVREALTRLSAAGVVETGNGRKPRVAAFSADIFTDLLHHGLATNNISTAQMMEARRGLEIESVRLATLRRDEQDLDKIAESIDQMQSAIEDQSRFIELDFAFHLGIAEATKNPVIVYLMTALRQPVLKTILTSFRQTSPSKQWLKKIARDHTLIFKLIKEQKVEAAMMALTNHLDQSLSAQNYWPLD